MCRAVVTELCACGGLRVVLHPQLHELVELAERLLAQAALRLVLVQLQLLQALAQLSGAQRVLGCGRRGVDGITHTILLLPVQHIVMHVTQAVSGADDGMA